MTRIRSLKAERAARTRSMKRRNDEGESKKALDGTKQKCPLCDRWYVPGPGAAIIHQANYGHKP